MTGCGSAWLERLVWDQEVAGSNPVTPIARKCRRSKEISMKILDFAALFMLVNINVKYAI